MNICTDQRLISRLDLVKDITLIKLYSDKKIQVLAPSCRPGKQCQCHYLQGLWWPWHLFWSNVHTQCLSGIWDMSLSVALLLFQRRNGISETRRCEKVELESWEVCEGCGERASWGQYLALEGWCNIPRSMLFPWKWWTGHLASIA